VQGFGEIALASPGRGIAIGVGGTSGMLQGQAAVNALRLGARAWIAKGPASVAFAVAPTRLVGAWFTDYGGRVQVEQGALTALGGMTVRQGSGLTASAGIDAAVIRRTGSRVSLEASGGRYLRDPYQALPAGWYLTAGLRLMLWTPPSKALASNVGQAALSAVSVGGLAATATPGMSGTRSVPAVSSGTGTGTGAGSTNAGGRGHRP
jgi:hypothetical protein